MVGLSFFDFDLHHQIYFLHAMNLSEEIFGKLYSAPLPVWLTINSFFCLSCVNPLFLLVLSAYKFA